MAWLFILTTGLSFAKDSPFADRKDELIVKVINRAWDYHHIKAVLDIVKPSRHYRYIPSFNPLNPKNVHRISSVYGMGLIEGKYKRHMGVNIVASKGTPVHASARGVIKKAIHSKKGYGNHIILEHSYGFESLYVHLFLIYVKPGQRVKKGDIIGFMGSSGEST